MPDAVPQEVAADPESLRDALARGNATISRIGPILTHLLATPDQSLISDEIVARIRGMCHSLAWQVLRAQAEAAGQAGRETFADRHGEALAEYFFSSPALLSHCHALALEWQLTERLESLHGLDPVLSPLIEHHIASEDAGLASAAMASLTAQARFAQTQRRMEVPLGELPGDLFHEILLTWRAFNDENASDALVRAEGRLRTDFDEASGRLSLLDRVATSLDKEPAAALVFDQAGVALFLSALALRTGQPRDIVTVSTNERQQARLALSLRAAGLKPQDVEAQLLRLHPDRTPPGGLADIGTREALNLLARSAGWAGSRA